jgi:heme-degrading monooxygenase HmoA
MYTRVIQATIRPKRIAEFKGAVTDHDLPIIRSQPGFVDDVEMYAGDQFISLTFWETEEDAERFTRDVFPRIAARSGPLVVSPLKAKAYKLEHDTVHTLRSETVETKAKGPILKFAVEAAA